MTAVFVAMIVSAGVGVGVASSLAGYAQRHWKNGGRTAGELAEA